MNCPHCGNPISSTNRFCSSCGADLGVGETLISRMPPPAQPPPSPEETIVSRMPPPPPPAYEPSYAPLPYSPAPPPAGETRGRNTTLIVAIVLILLCCFCLIAIVAAYMLFGEDIAREISLVLSLV